MNWLVTMKYNRTMRIDLGNKSMMKAINHAIEHKHDKWSLEGMPCNIVDIVRIERTNTIEIRLLQDAIK